MKRYALVVLRWSFALRLQPPASHLGIPAPAIRCLNHAVRGGLAVLGFVCASVAVGLSHPAAPNSSCPGGTRATANGCVLDADLVLTESLELQSFTRLNCRGRRLLPSSAGSGTTPDTYVASVPATAIVITGDRGVDVRNCIIGQEGAWFDFGIIAINSKQAGRAGHRIHNNVIQARDAAITLLRVDDARITANLITWSNGVGISFARDSDRNRVQDNVMWSTVSPPAVHRFVPEGPFRTMSDEGILMVPLHLQPLFNLVVGGRLYQFPNSEDGHYAGHEDNVVERNFLSLPGSSAGKAHTAIFVGGNALRTRVAGNLIAEAATGIRLAGFMRAQAVSRPGRCVTPAGQATMRYCQTDADCSISPLDPTPVGTCSGLVSEVRDLRAHDTLVEHNTLIGPFNSTVPMLSAAIVGGNSTVGGVIRGNQVLAKGIEAGITLAGEMIQTGVVTENVVQGASFGLVLQQGPATMFGARVFLNDFTGSTQRAVGVLGTYSLQTDLSWDGVGNYWGHVSPPCFRHSDSPIPGLIQDTNPFCRPAARSVEAERR